MPPDPLPTPSPSHSLASLLYPARADDPDRLFKLLPADLRRRDFLAGQVLQALMRIVGEQYAVLEADVVRMYDDLSVETCRPWVLPYLAELLGREEGAVVDPRRAGQVRRLVGTLVAARRRQGSVAAVRTAVRDLGGPSSFLVETITRVERTPAVCRPPGVEVAANELTPSVTDPRGFDSPYAWQPTTPEVRRVEARAGATPGHFHPDGVEVHVGRLSSFRLDRVRPGRARPGGSPTVFLGTFDALGGAVPLVAPESGETGEAVGPRNFVLPIRGRLMAARLLDYYGPGKAVEVWVGGRRLSTREVMVADIPGGPGQWHPPAWALATGRMLIDPERGRLAQRRPQTYVPTDPEVEVTYHVGRYGAVGGGYPRAVREVGPDESLIRVGRKLPADTLPTDRVTAPKRWQFASLCEALATFEKHQAGMRVVIEIADSDTYSWGSDKGKPRTVVTIPEGSRLTLRAAAGAWPLLANADCHPVAHNPIRFSAPGIGSRLVLDGVRIGREAVHIDGDLRTVIRDATLVPGLEPHGGEGPPAQAGAVSLVLAGVRAGVVVERSVVGRIQVSSAPRALTKPQHPGEPLPLVVRNSVLDASTDQCPAIAGLPPERCNSPVAYAALVVRNATILGRVDVHQLVSAVDSIFTGPCSVARRQTGCVRFCYLPFESVTPPRYRCQPDLGRSDLRRLLHPSSVTTDPLAAQLADLTAGLEPRFASRRYDRPIFAALRTGTAAEILTGASDGGEMGAFHDLNRAARDRALLSRLAELVPARLDLRLITHPGTVL